MRDITRQRSELKKVVSESIVSLKTGKFRFELQFGRGDVGFLGVFVKVRDVCIVPHLGYVWRSYLYIEKEIDYHSPPPIGPEVNQSGYS